MRLLIRLSIGVALLALATFAQSTTQQITGTVTDASGSIVPLAKVTATHLSTGQIRSVVASDSGNYAVTSMPLGEYEITVEAQGFKKATQKNIKLDVNAKLEVNIRLEVGSITESVTVTADAAQVETTNGDVGRLITGQQATNLQLNGRNFTQLLSLIPGVATTNRSAMDLFGGYGSNASAQSANGGRTDTFSWNIDGVDNKDNGGGGNNFVNINPDAIAEFKVLTTNYSAEYGQNSGAIINLAMKSGSRDFHGTAYEYVRNDAFDARAFNAITKQKLRFNNWGWNLGGPVFIPGKWNADRNKAFFFFSQEFKRYKQGAINTWNVPTLALRAGDFTAVAASSRPKDPTTGVAFPDGIIPKSRISPNMDRLIKNYPVPNFTGSGGNLVFPTTTPNTVNQYLIRGDYMLNSQHQLSVHYAHDTYSNLNNLTSLVTYTRDIPGTSAKAQWTWVANATTVNTFTGSFSGNVILQGNFLANPAFISDYTRKGQGITYPMIYGKNGTIPTVNIAGFNGLGASNVNWNNFNRVFTAKDDFSKFMGSHSLKAGILIMRSRKNQDNWPAVNGTASYATGHSNSTGNAMGDALLGNFSQYTEADTNREGWYRFTQIEGYFQDDWKISQRLTLNLGMRYQYMQPQYCALNNCVMFGPSYYNSSKAMLVNRSTGALISGSGDPYNGLVLGGTGFSAAAKARIPQASDPAVLALFRGIPMETANKYWPTWGPRIGFAFDLTGKQQTVLRGGMGMFYERIEGNFIFSAINNTPFIAQSDVYDGNLESPTGGTKNFFPPALSNSHPVDYKIPRVVNWSFGVQHKIDAVTTLDVAYVGSTAANLSRTLNLNQLKAGTLQANPGVNTNALRPYLGYANINWYVTGANSIYNSLQVQTKRQMRGGGLVNASYTWSRAITDSSAYNETPMDSYNAKLDRGLATFHRAHVFVLSYIYPLPFWAKGGEWYKIALGGWQVAGMTSMQTGIPLNLAISPDTAGIGQTSQRPNVIGDWAADAQTQYKWFNQAAFAVPAAGTFGNLGRNVIMAPGQQTWDVSAQKYFNFTERVRMQFRAEFYNFPNHMNWWGVATTVGASNFGQITSGSDPRTLQLGLRLQF